MTNNKTNTIQHWENVDFIFINDNQEVLIDLLDSIDYVML